MYCVASIDSIKHDITSSTYVSAYSAYKTLGNECGKLQN
jgi:hypothetical protein